MNDDTWRILAPSDKIFQMYCFRHGAKQARRLEHVNEVIGITGRVIVIIGDEYGSFTFPDDVIKAWKFLSNNPLVDIQYEILKVRYKNRD